MDMCHIERVRNEEERKREKDKGRVMEIEGDRRSDGLKNSRGRI